jgi:hypothetical protein
VDLVPYFGSGNTGILVDFSDHHEMRLMVLVDPTYKKSHEIIWAESDCACICYQFLQHLPLVRGIGGILKTQPEVVRLVQLLTGNAGLNIQEFVLFQAYSFPPLTKANIRKKP